MPIIATKLLAHPEAVQDFALFEIGKKAVAQDVVTCVQSRKGRRAATNRSARARGGEASRRAHKHDDK